MTSEQVANNRAGDCDYWGLTAAQSSRYLARLSAYHARRARWHADQAGRWHAVSGAAAAVASLLVAGNAVIRLLT